DGRIVVGVLVASEGRVAILQSTGEMAPVDLGSVSGFDLILADEAKWHGVLAAGVELNRGNAETLTVATNGVATRVGPRDRLGLFGTYLFSSVGVGANEFTTASASRGGGRYDHDLVGALYGFGFAEAETDALQLLDSRIVGGGGLGVHVFNTGMSQFNLFAGVSYAADRYAQVTTTTPTTPTTPEPTRGGTPPVVVRTTLSRDVAEVLAGQGFFHQVSNSVGLYESLTIFTATTSISNFRITSDYRISFDLSLWAQL